MENNRNNPKTCTVEKYDKMRSFIIIFFLKGECCGNCSQKQQIQQWVVAQNSNIAVHRKEGDY